MHKSTCFRSGLPNDKRITRPNVFRNGVTTLLMAFTSSIARLGSSFTPLKPTHSPSRRRRIAQLISRNLLERVRGLFFLMAFLT
ncbi:hypothetical protein TNIN_251591 [Trichonephila inaurata madagascariensis]|uniref:Uncharacterized protein n=1 Tax=Trichonephila inaurata madagascariensis TaxID=2747483 RepID=A0A8X6YQB2_9ARAC|nr:hypothetical protein TNIN_251591 [Trichonephila inaurata madagascariensis]